MVRRWLTMPHVVQWWGNPDEQFALISGDLEEPAMEQFIVTNGDRPFGYLQSFNLKNWPEEAFGPQPDGTRSIDQFIGKPNMIDRGHGSAFIRAFVTGLFESGTPRVITDPDPNNGRAIKAYENAGFHRERVVEAHDGPSLLMVCNA
jgi:aminoglycoside 6'-N-acetyltransferase